MNFLKNGSGSDRFKKRLRLPNTGAEQTFFRAKSTRSNPVMSDPVPHSHAYQDPDPHSHADPAIFGQIHSWHKLVNFFTV